MASLSIDHPDRPLTVAAIVVTFNRKELLIRCLESLLQQTRPVETIFVIDNASTDGTSERLEAEGYCHHGQIAYIRLSENTGGAGGFYEGMKRAYAAGYDWLWLMDDDGFCAPDALAQLLQRSAELDVIGSAVVLADKPDQMSWPIRVVARSGYFKLRSYISTLSELKNYASDGIYPGAANFFNAILFRRQVIQSLGLVNKELFIWGDDYEYFLRCKAANFRIGTNVHALYFHPEKLSNISELKYYYYLRNLYYTYSKYGDIIYPPFIRIVYPVYIFFRWLPALPSLHPTYLYKLLMAIVAATGGRLIPYSSEKS